MESLGPYEPISNQESEMSLDVHLEVIAPTQVYWANITHNLGKMAGEAGIYQHLWRPEELEITTASELIKPLQVALKDLRERPEYFKQFNPENGWGDYDGFVQWVSNYLGACVGNPLATIRVSR